MIFKKMFIAVFLLAFTTIVGCETVKGAGGGAVEGAKKDWQSAKELDAKMRQEQIGRASCRERVFRAV
jgi:predicted small secreted protein